MLVVKIFISLLIASVIGEQADTSCSKDTVEDIVSLLQTDVKSGTSQSKLEANTKLEPKALHQRSEGEQLRIFATFLEQHTNMLSKGFAEFVAMTLFVFIGCGSACANAGSAGNWQFQVSLTFGFAITAVAYSIGHISGGQINCAVTFGLWCSGHIALSQALFNFVCQMFGSICGAFLTYSVFGDGGSKTTDKTGGLGCNEVAPAFGKGQAMIGEIMGTFILVFTVLNTAVDLGTLPNRPQACLAIGISVFLAHCVLINVDGCSINPTRSFGPMVVRMFTYKSSEDAETKEAYKSDHWIFWVGPLVGAALAAGVYSLF